MAIRKGRLPLIRMRTGLFALTALFTASVHAVPPVVIVGLFKDQAVVQVAGNQRLLKVGQTSPEGVELLAANTREAVVRYQGERYTLNLSDRVSSGFRDAEKPSITIPSDEMGQYRVRGTINGQYVNFLLDTGASIVALSTREAQRLGLEYSDGEPGTVQTAQGTTNSHFLTVDEMSVAGITARNVQVAVIEGNYPVEILLGMTFLRQVTMRENEGVMTLTQKF